MDIDLFFHVMVCMYVCLLLVCRWRCSLGFVPSLNVYLGISTQILCAVIFRPYFKIAYEKLSASLSENAAAGVAIEETDKNLCTRK